MNGLLEGAIDRDLIQNEWYDGEDYLQAGAAEAITSAFEGNRPSRVTVYVGFMTRETRVVRDSGSRVEAEEYAQWSNFDPYLVHVAPYTDGAADPTCGNRYWHHIGQRCHVCGGVG